MLLHVGQTFGDHEALEKGIEQLEKLENCELWVRDSRTVDAAVKRARRKQINPKLKYAEVTYHCVYGGRNPSERSKIHNQ